MRSVKNTAQITKAMEVVSATKMRKSQEFAIRARPYAVASLDMLQNLLSRTPERPLLLQSRPVARSLLLVVTSDKGLAGAFNTNTLKKADTWIALKRKENSPFSLVTVGKKAKDYYERRNVPIEKSFWEFGDYSALSETKSVAEEVIRGFTGKNWDEVEVIYTHFRTTLRQETLLRRILPVTAKGIEEIVAGILPERGRYAVTRDVPQATRYTYEYKFEPSPEEILNVLIPQLLFMHVHHVILESNASEHSSRMVAMKSASDNAKDLIGALALQYNKSRQASITRELTEITAGKEALEQ